MLQQLGWLDQVVAAASAGEPLLVVCRTTATVRAVYRRFAQEALAGRRFGWTDVAVTTLDGLIASARPRALGQARDLGPAAALPTGHPLQLRLDGRPGLRRMLRQRLERLHGVQLAGAPLDGLAPHLRSLLDAGWGQPDWLDGARRLLERPPAVSRRIAVGFAPEPYSFGGLVGPLERALLKSIATQTLDAGDPSKAQPGPLKALRLPDTAAEARAVVRAVDRSGQSLVLVADAQTGERVQAALKRNGIPVAGDASSPLTRHSLYSILEPLLPLFASHGREQLEARDLLRLVTDPVLSRAPVAQQGEMALPGVGAPQASLRCVREAIVDCRRVRATLDEWLRALQAQERQARDALKAAADDRSEPVQRLASLRILLSQLRALEKHARGAGRLGDLAQLVAELGLSSPEDDPLGRAIVAALQSEGHRPADSEAYREALAGSVSSGRIDLGVEVLSYAAYDGRDCDLLVLTGVHDQGLGATPGPDPLLTETDLRLSGMPTPRELIGERLALARWAASRARETLALVADTDATGRPVNPPVELALDVDDSDRRASYGLSFDLPEQRDVHALRCDDEQPSVPGIQDPLCRQADVEWVRRGADLVGARSAPASSGSTLVDQLERDLPRLPEDLLPWLGRSGRYPGTGGGLAPRFILTATKLEPFTRCLYRAFCQHVLGIKPVEEVEEELDAREVGTAVHGALEKAMLGVRLAVPAAELEEARRDAAERLRAKTVSELEAVVGKRPGDHRAQPMVVAREGLARRWMSHWEVYLSGRIQSVEEANGALWAAALRREPFAAQLAALADSIGGPAMSPTPKERLRSKLRDALQRSAGNVDNVLAQADSITGALAAKHRGPVGLALRSAAVRQGLEALASQVLLEIGAQELAAGGDLEVVALEQAFGEGEDRSAALPMPLGREPTPARGRIDAIARHLGGSRHSAAARVIDFKTGTRAAKREDLLESLTKPQLLLYALALEQGSTAIDGVELDFVRLGKRVGVALEPADLARAARVIGALLDRARDGFFPLAPHPRCCPLLSSKGAYCDFSELCRLRPEYTPEPTEGDDA